MFDRFKNIFGKEETEQNVEQAEEVAGVVEETQGNLDTLEEEVKTLLFEGFFASLESDGGMFAGIKSRFQKGSLVGQFLSATRGVFAENKTGLSGVTQYLIPYMLKAEMVGKTVSFVAPEKVMGGLYRAFVGMQSVASLGSNTEGESPVTQIFDQVMDNYTGDEKMMTVLTNFKNFMERLVIAPEVADLQALKTELQSEGAFTQPTSEPQGQADAGSTTPDTQTDNSEPTEGGATSSSTNNNDQSSTA